MLVLMSTGSSKVVVLDIKAENSISKSIFFQLPNLTSFGWPYPSLIWSRDHEMCERIEHVKGKGSWKKDLLKGDHGLGNRITTLGLEGGASLSRVMPRP